MTQNAGCTMQRLSKVKNYRYRILQNVCNSNNDAVSEITEKRRLCINK